MHVVITPVYVDEVLYMPGEQLSLPDEQAEHLGSAVLAIKAPAPAKEQDAKPKR